jgi:EmrB/QacA subfamily drug resistance transporter
MSEDKKCTLRSSNGRWILFATIMASGSAFLSGSAVPIALPVIQSDFGTTLSGIQWIVNANLLSLGALILIGGALGDHFGRKRIFSIGMAIFGAAALASGLAPSLPVLIFFQAVQGAGAALMIPQSLAIINDCFSENERGRAIGIWAGISGGIAALGPLAGGLLVDKFSWGAVFFLIVPVSLASLIIILLFVPSINRHESHKLDWQGALAIFIGLFGLVYGLMTGTSAGWESFEVLISLGVGMISIGLFIFVEMHQKQPLVCLSIFKNSLVTGANIVTLLVYFGLTAVTFFTVLNLQQVQNYSPAQAGIALLPPIVLITLLTWPTGAIADRLGPRFQMILGPLVVSAGMLFLAASGSGQNYWTHFLPGLTFFGLGMAVIIPPLTKCALYVEEVFSGSASGINNGTARIAGLLAIAILGAVVLATFRNRLNLGLADSNLSSHEQQQLLTQANKLGGITVPNTFGEAAKAEAENIIHSAFIDGYRTAMNICAVMAFGGALASFAFIHNRLIKTGGGK